MNQLNTTETDSLLLRSIETLKNDISQLVDPLSFIDYILKNISPKNLIENLITFIQNGEYYKHNNLSQNKVIISKLINELSLLTEQYSNIQLMADIEVIGSTEDKYKNVDYQTYFSACKIFYNSLNYIAQALSTLELIVIHKSNLSSVTLIFPIEIFKEEQEKLNLTDLELVKHVLQVEIHDFEISSVSLDSIKLLKSLNNIFNKITTKRNNKDIRYLKLISKVLFLMKKVAIALDLDDISISSSISSVKIKTLNEALQHYYNEKTNDLISFIKIDRLPKLDNESLQKLKKLQEKYKNMHSLHIFLEVKILKDEATDINADPITLYKERLNRLLSLFEKEFKLSQKDNEDIYSSINTIYIGNNYISLADEFLASFKEIEKSDLSFVMKLGEHVEFVFAKIKQIDRNLNPNYFTNYKYTLFKCNYYRLLNVLDHEKASQKLLLLFNDVQSNFSKLEKFQKYQLPHSEAFININNEQVYFLSSVCTIFDVLGEENRILELRYKISELLINYKTTQDTNKFAQNINQQNKDIKRELKEHSKKSTEILAIFSAIVIFASGNIQLFTRLSTIGEALIIMMAFSIATLTIFSSIHLIMDDNTSVKEKLLKQAYLLIPITLISIIAYVFTYKIPLSKHQTEGPSEPSTFLIQSIDQGNKSNISK